MLLVLRAPKMFDAGKVCPGVATNGIPNTMTEPNLKKKGADKGTEESEETMKGDKRQGGQIHMEKSRPDASSGANKEQERSGSRKNLELAGRGVRANPDAGQSQRYSKRETEEEEESDPRQPREGADDDNDVASPIDERAARKRRDEFDDE